MNDCVFCKIVAGEIPSALVLSDERVVVVMDINPVAHGHCLVVTKEHRPTLRETTEEEGAAVMSAARRVATAIQDALHPNGLNLHQSNGSSAGQLVGHFHLHVVPRWEGDGLRLGWPSHAADPDRIAEVAASIAASLPSTGADG